MKAIIPVAGAGTRLRPHTYTQPKPLIPVAGKPIISYIIDELLRADVKEFVFVLGYLGDKIQDYIETQYPDLHTEFVYQVEREGLGHAIWTAKESIRGSEEIIIMLGDTIVDMDMSAVLRRPESCLGVMRVKDPRNFGVVVLDDDGFVTQVIEKPLIPTSNLALVGLYKIHETAALLEALEYNISHDVRNMGEFQLSDAFQRMIKNGVRMTTTTVNRWFDCGKRDILLQTNATLLDREGMTSDDLPTFDNTIIIHPVSIGTNCKISNSIIGPHVSIGDNTVIAASIVRSSIIGSFTSLDGVVLHDSIIGSDTAITGPSQRLNIGDNTEINFSK